MPNFEFEDDETIEPRKQKRDKKPAEIIWPWELIRAANMVFWSFVVAWLLFGLFVGYWIVIGIMTLIVIIRAAG